MWLQDIRDKCPVCLRKLSARKAEFSYHIIGHGCPTYHFYTTGLSHSIYMDGDYIVWNEGVGNKYCELHWNGKYRRIDWLELTSPINLEDLKKRINNLLLFL